MQGYKVSMKILFALLACAVCAMNCAPFLQSKQTPIIAVLNDASYASIDSAYGTSELDRVNNRLEEIKSTYPQTSSVLQNISVVEANANYSIFINEETKQLYFTLRGTSFKKGSDLANDAQLGLNLEPSRLSQINAIMEQKVLKYANSGYSVNVSGHSLGGTLALMTCVDNVWIAHCEVHNPFLNDTIISKLNYKINLNYIANKFFVQITNGDLVSTFFPKTKLAGTYSYFDQLPNVRGLIDHSDLTLLAKVFFNETEIVNFTTPFISIDAIMNYIVKLDEKFKQIFNLVYSCNSAYYFSWDILSCLTCPVGRSCTHAILGPRTCAPGYFGYRGECYECNFGQYQLQAGAASCVDCPIGHYCPSATEPPKPAPAGGYQSSTNEKSWKACPPGMYTLIPAQAYCNECPLGNYCPSTKQGPIPAPVGRYQPYMNRSWYLFCPEGQYNMETGQSKCKDCPVGHFCRESTEEPVKVPPGYYQPYINNREYYYCPTGMYSAEAGSTECMECPVGSYCRDPSKPPVLAPIGGYTNVKNSEMYRSCPSGMYNLSLGQTDCLECPIGSYCPRRDQAPLPCPRGYCCPKKNLDGLYYYCSSSSRFLEVFGRNV